MDKSEVQMITHIYKRKTSVNTNANTSTNTNTNSNTNIKTHIWPFFLGRRSAGARRNWIAKHSHFSFPSFVFHL